MDTLQSHCMLIMLSGLRRRSSLFLLTKAEEGEDSSIQSPSSGEEESDSYTTATSSSELFELDRSLSAFGIMTPSLRSTICSPQSTMQCSPSPPEASSSSEGTPPTPILGDAEVLEYILLSMEKEETKGGHRIDPSFDSLPVIYVTQPTPRPSPPQQQQLPKPPVYYHHKAPVYHKREQPAPAPAKRVGIWNIFRNMTIAVYKRSPPSFPPPTLRNRRIEQGEISIQDAVELEDMN